MSEPRFHVNGEPWRWRPGLDIAALLAERDIAPDSVATALNGVFVPRTARAGTVLQPGDALVLFAAITGG